MRAPTLAKIAFAAVALLGFLAAPLSASAFTSSFSQQQLLQLTAFNTIVPASPSWKFASSSIGAAGASSTIQYNANGALAGSTGLVYTGSNLGIGTSSPSARLAIAGLAGSTSSLFTISSTTTTGTTTTVLQVDSQGTFNFGGASEAAMPAVFKAYSGSATSQLTFSRIGSPFFGFTHSSTGQIGNIVQFSGTGTASSGNYNYFAVIPSLSQSGTAGYSALKVMPAETTLGSGAHLLLQVGTSTAPDLFDVTNLGYVGIGSSSPATTLTVQGYIQPVSVATTTACSTVIEGAQFYNLGNHHLWLCMGSEPWALLK